MSNDDNPLRKFTEENLGISQPKKTGVMLPGANISLTDTATALFQAILPFGDVFFRGDKVVRSERISGSPLPILKVLKPSEARSVFEEYVDFFVMKKGELVEMPMNKDTAEAMLESPVAKQILANITGLINTPLAILLKGEVHVLTPGYDKNTGLFVTGEEIVEPSSIAEAKAMIETALTDFDFQSESDISRAIAAIMTPALKFGGFIRGTIPIEIIEADESQSGKGYLNLRRAAIYGEIPTTVSHQKGGVGSVDEKLASALAKGRPFVVLDNWRGKLESAFLESFLTAPANFSIRIPKEGETYVDPSRYVLTITSNGLTTTEDLANRATFIRLKKDSTAVTEVGGKRMLETILDTQPYFLGAVVKIIREWHSEGMPRTNERRHSFAAWAQTLDWIVTKIFDFPPLLDGMRETQDRIKNPHASFLRLVAIQVERKEQLAEGLPAHKLVELCEEADITIPGLASNYSYNENVPAQRIGAIMKAAFGESDELVVERFRIVRTEASAKNDAGNVVHQKFYQFYNLERNQ